MVHIIKKVSHGGTRVAKDGEMRKFCLNGKNHFWYIEDEKTINDVNLAKSWARRDKWSFDFWLGIISGFPLEDILFYCDVWTQNLSREFPEWSRVISKLDEEYCYVLSPQAIERIMRHKNYKSE